MPKPDLKDLSTELSYRVCKHILGDGNEQCKMLYQKAKNKEIPLNDYTEEMQKLIEGTEEANAEQGRTEEAGGAGPSETVP